MKPLQPNHTGPPVLEGFCAVTLNIGGRNSNPVEFVMQGDESDLGVACTALGVQLLEGMGSDTFGPGSMREAERRAVDGVLADVGSDEAVATLLDQPTWVRVYEVVRRDMSGLFNALNLATLQLGRPSALEAPELCRAYRDDLDYIAGWRAWYAEIDRAGKFWTEEAKKKASKHGLPVGNAFGGLFLYDFLGVQAMKASFGASPFRGVADFAEQLPFATFTGKHAAAARYFRNTDAAIICVQEGRALFDYPAISERYQCFKLSLRITRNCDLLTCITCKCCYICNFSFTYRRIYM